MYKEKPHLCCPCNIPGNLTFNRQITVNIVLNKFAVKRFHVEPKIKQLTKDLYKCDKCGEEVNVIVCPSWEDYVLSGRIRVKPWIYKRLKRAAEKRRKANVKW